MRTGENGCLWVCMGELVYGRHGGHKNKANGGHLGSRRPGIGSYGRGNFPGHHVLGGQAKTGTDGYRWVKTGADGCSGACGRGGNAKQQKEIRKCTHMAIFGNT